MNKEYTDLAIYYCNKFLDLNLIYIGDNYYNYNNIELYEYQHYIFNYMLGNLYLINLEYDKALNCAFMSKGIEKYIYYFDSYFDSYYDILLLIFLSLLKLI